jgi:hypothetical protein
VAWVDLPQETYRLNCALWVTQSDTWESLGSLGVIGISEALSSHVCGTHLIRLGEYTLGVSVVSANVNCDCNGITVYLYFCPSVCF